MRSVIVYPVAGRAAVEDVLDLLGPEQREPWHIDGCLHARVVADGDGGMPLLYGLEADEIRALEDAVGHRPGWAVFVDVSWSVDGEREVRRLVLALLRGGGAAVDDNSSRPWAPDEIRADRPAGDLRFFSGTRRTTT